MDINYYKSKYEPIAGEWYIKEQLGKGSYGQVFRIEKEDMSGTYSAALKIITIPQSEEEVDKVRNMLQDENSVTQYFKNLTQKLVSEFKLMSELKGTSNIVSYEGHSIHEHTDGIGYDVLIRMELLSPLNNRLDALNEQEIIKLGIDICKALETCQKYNIVHRDIKPENIFVSKHGDYKLGDFGVAKTMENDVTFMTTTGTYIYMAPELKKGEQCGTNVDIYSLGMVMYKLLNHNREPFLPLPPEMFTFEQREQALVNRMKGMPLPKPAQASDRLSEIIIKACEYNPQKRYESPLQMRMELENLLLGHRVIEEDVLPKTDALDLTEDDEQETEGIFGKRNEIKTEKPSVIEKEHTVIKEIQGDPEPIKKQYKVRLCKVMPSNMFRGIDVYVDGEIVHNGIISNEQTLSLNEGTHNIKIVMTQLSKALGTLDKANKLLGANQSIEVTVNSETDIYYRLNTATGGIDLVDPNKKQTKSKKVALALAIFPYTGIFGIHDFYLGKKANGFLKLFTLNFCAIGWMIDIIIILCGKYTTNDGDYLK